MIPRSTHDDSMTGAGFRVALAAGVVLFSCSCSGESAVDPSDVPDAGGDESLSTSGDSGVRSDGGATSNRDGAVPGRDSGSAATGGGDSGAGACATDCSHCGPLEACFAGKFCVAKSVTVAAPSGGTPYGIDATEVTRCQYAAWIATRPSLAEQDPWCMSNTSFQVNDGCMQTLANCKTGCEDHPQVCVNSCDATAYCKAVGKRLCGKIGGDHPNFDAFDNASEDQWYNACSGGGKNTYPYGDTYDGQACNGYDNAQTGCQTGSCDTRPGGDVTTCQSKVAGYAGVFDLSGNVFEWEDSCDQYVGDKDRCRFRGGSFISSYGADNGNALRCNYDIAGSRDDAYSNLGFRCCAQ